MAANNLPLSLQQDELWMHKALQAAQQAEQIGEVPVGAVLVEDNRLIATGYNQAIHRCDPCAHAEINCLQSAGAQLANYRFPDATLYVTLEPCTMCFGAMVHARIKRLVFGAAEPKAGVISSQLSLHKEAFYNHRFTVTEGVLATECSTLLTHFFAERRRAKKTNNENSL